MTEQTPQTQDKAAKPKALAKVAKAEAKLLAEQQARAVKNQDTLKLCVAVILVAAGIWAFYGIAGLPAYVSALFPLVAVILALLIVFYWCDFGRRLIAYIRDSVTEFKKVVWPKRSEANRMTILVVVFVSILALFIYFVDSLVSWVFFDVILRRG